MVKLAVFGAGRIGNIHARNAAAHPAITLKYVADPNAEAARALARATGASVADGATVLADGDLDGVVIASATDTHADLLAQAAERKLAIFCEKPISLDMATVERTVDLLERSGVKVLLGFNRRYDPHFKAVRDRVRSGEGGPVEQVVITSRDPGPPPLAYIKVSGGLFRDQTIHDFDMARYILGEEIETVHAVGACFVEPGIGAAGDIDTAVVTMTTQAGRMVQIVNSRRATYGYDQRLEVLCAREALFVDNVPQTTMVRADADGVTRAPLETFFLERYRQAYVAEMDGFARLIQDGTPPLADHKDGLAAQRLAEAAVESHREGRPVRVAR